jgi:hypothetical protein
MGNIRAALTLVGIFPGLEACLDLKTKGPLHLLTKFVTLAELRTAGKKRLVRHLQAAGGLPKVEDLADRVLTAAAEQAIAVPAERMTARLIRELAVEALASRTRLIELDGELEDLLRRHPGAALIRSLPGMGQTVLLHEPVDPLRVDRCAPVGSPLALDERGNPTIAVGRALIGQPAYLGGKFQVACTGRGPTPLTQTLDPPNNVGAGDAKCVGNGFHREPSAAARSAGLEHGPMMIAVR